MLIDATELDGPWSATAQVCIVGGGPAGITVAHELERLGREVILLESGGLERSDDAQALASGELVGRPFAGEEGLDVVRLRLLGGTSGHWAGYCRPFEPVLFGGSRPYLGATDFPFPREQLEPWWAIAADLLGLVDPAPGAHWWHDTARTGSPPLTSDRLTAATYQIQPRRLGLDHRASLEASTAVTLVVGATVTELVPDEADRSIEMVEALTLAGTELTVRADAVVVATGGIDTPRLLLASNSRRPAGLGNENDLVGRHFMEHPQTTGGVAILSGEPDMWRHLDSMVHDDLEPTVPTGLTTKGVLVPGDEAVIDDERLCVEIQALVGPGSRPPIAQDDAADAETVGSALLPDRSGEGTALVLQVLTEQEPNPLSRVTIGRDRDAVGMPRPIVDWRLSQRDLDNLRWGVERVALEVGRLGLGRVQVGLGDVSITQDPDRHQAADGLVERFDVRHDPDDADLVVAHANHHMGTTRMAVSPANGVVDTDCRVHSVENLFIAGSAVFPVAGAVPPTFNLMALAARLADHLHTTVLDAPG